MKSFSQRFPEIAGARQPAGVIASIAVAWCCGAQRLHAEAGATVSHPDFAAEQVAFFQSEVRPILEQNCFRCHGGRGDDGAVKVRSGLQLISRRGVILGGDHGSAINPDDPGSSLLLEMVSYRDEHHEMPPTGKLEPEQIATLGKWVAMGVPWTPDDIDLLEQVAEEKAETTAINDHTRAFWSHKPLQRPAVPEVADPRWQKHPVDAFIYARLAENGLKPNAPAARQALIRRAYYNLTGLPPSPEAVTAFVNDPSPDAWPKLIDELLDSPRYGEHWARHWLDIVRYAESNGFERDSTKEHIWRYRDYVIDAFNADKPYDRFIKEQLAGDELEDVTPESIIATGYHRLMQWDDEPADREQHVYDVLDDNVRVTSEAMLGMTLGCARCHDHKGDPVSQKDYYSFMAFFKGVTQMDKQRVIQPVSLPAPDEVVAERTRKREQEIARLEETVGRLRGEVRAAMVAREPGLEPLLSAESAGALISDSRSEGQEWRYTLEEPADDWFAVGFRPPASWKTGKGAFGTGVPNSSARTSVAFTDIWMQKTFSLTELPKSLELVIYHDEAAEVYLNGQPLASFEGYITDYRNVSLDERALSLLQTGRNVIAVHCRNTGGGAYIDLGLREVSGEVLLTRLIEERGGELVEEQKLRRLGSAHGRLEKLRNEPVEEDIMAMTVQESGADPGEMFVHIRGSVHAPGDKVVPGVPQILDEGRVVDIPEPAPGSPTSGRRRVLAEWIASPENRRTSRVMANRLWQHHFGRGICPTPSDFGYLGELPSHPELLDWLATEFTRGGWSVKAMHRLLMTSLSYQMASTGNAAALEKDPANQLFWRFPMRRLTAEEIRDSMISVTGRLNPRMGGSSFFPLLDEEVLATSSTKAGKWGQSSPDDLERRSIYIHIKRSLKPPELEGFDFADTDAPCAARFVTTVPTQALAMLNSRMVNDQAAKLADRLRREVAGGDVAAQVRRGLELALTRDIAPGEVSRGMELIATLRDTHGLTADQALDRFCLVALNLNEFVYLD